MLITFLILRHYYFFYYLLHIASLLHLHFYIIAISHYFILPLLFWFYANNILSATPIVLLCNNTLINEAILTDCHLLHDTDYIMTSFEILSFVSHQLVISHFTFTISSEYFIISHIVIASHIIIDDAIAIVIFLTLAILHFI